MVEINSANRSRSFDTKLKIEPILSSKRRQKPQTEDFFFVFLTVNFMTLSQTQSLHNFLEMTWVEQ